MSSAKKSCSIAKQYGFCGVSTGICERLTFGGGELDDYGYWEFPCDECARENEKNYPEDGECWPPNAEDSEWVNSMADKEEKAGGFPGVTGKN
jgi:hypothetical protein